MRYIVGIIFCLVVFAVTILVAAAEPGETYTLILYGGRHSNDLETIAFLDREGDGYTFEVYAPDFDYRIERGLSSADALRKAKEFVGWHNAFSYSQTVEIKDKSGVVIGYEIRPMYMPFVFGVSDVMDVYYTFNGNSVIIKVRLKPQIERMLLYDGFNSDRD
jgi:hypothetical protein